MRVVWDRELFPEDVEPNDDVTLQEAEQCNYVCCTYSDCYC